MQENIKENGSKLFGNLRAARKQIDGNKPLNHLQVWNHTIFAYKSTYQEIGDLFYEIKTQLSSNSDFSPPPADADAFRLDAYVYDLKFTETSEVDEYCLGNNWIGSLGWVPKDIGKFDDEEEFKNNLQPSHCTITKENVERF